VAAALAAGEAPSQELAAAAREIEDVRSGVVGPGPAGFWLARWLHSGTPFFAHNAAFREPVTSRAAVLARLELPLR
jgi:hypothetical protein